MTCKQCECYEKHLTFLYDMMKRGEEFPPEVILCVSAPIEDDDMQWAKDNIYDLERESGN